jgi:hypothetical protein
MTNGDDSKSWIPFRPSRDDLARLAAEVAAIPDLQATLVENHPHLKVRDRVAHQYQIAGGRVTLKVAAQLPEVLNGLGLFQPNAEHIGIGRVSTGLGCPHAETDPDFLGLMLAFQTPAGRRVDFLAINDPTSPTDTHRDFMTLLAATCGGGRCEIAVRQRRQRAGPGGSDRLQRHPRQSSWWRSWAAMAARSRRMWSGRPRAPHARAAPTRLIGPASSKRAGRAGKFVIAPTLADQNPHRSFGAGPRHLTVDWRARQARDDVTFDLYWIPFIDQETTSTVALIKAWDEQRQRVGRIAFPRQDANDKDAALWAILADEMGANAGKLDQATAPAASRSLRRNSPQRARSPTARARMAATRCRKSAMRRYSRPVRSTRIWPSSCARVARARLLPATPVRRNSVRSAPGSHVVELSSVPTHTR